MVTGVINFDKPSGCTSHDAVAFLRILLGRSYKVGHTGTLDPAASGVLPLCVGKATKLAQYMSASRKTYYVEALLDRCTDTGDLDGQVIETFAPSSIPSLEDVLTAMSKLTGPIEQVPPMYSAIKVNGVRLYELARKGKTVERKARAVTINSFELISYHWPTLKCRVDCSSGTYIRTLIEDMGKSMTIGGTVKTLRRESVGSLDINQSHTPFDIAKAAIEGDLESLFAPWDTVFPKTSRAEILSGAMEKVRNGAPVTEDQIVRQFCGEGNQLLLMTEDGKLVALYRMDTEQMNFKAEKVLL